MDTLIPIIMLVFAVSAWQNARRIRPGNARNGLRWVALTISLYIALIYLLATIGVIPVEDIRLYLRWFLIPVGMYMIIEAVNG